MAGIYASMHAADADSSADSTGVKMCRRWASEESCSQLGVPCLPQRVCGADGGVGQCNNLRVVKHDNQKQVFPHLHVAPVGCIGAVVWRQECVGAVRCLQSAVDLAVDHSRGDLHPCGIASSGLRFSQACWKWHKVIGIMASSHMG
eukprot:366182-Chlamydomonas_euryale.AAC.17